SSSSPRCFHCIYLFLFLSGIHRLARSSCILRSPSPQAAPRPQHHYRRAQSPTVSRQPALTTRSLISRVTTHNAPPSRPHSSQARHGLPPAARPAAPHAPLAPAPRFPSPSAPLRGPRPAPARQLVHARAQRARRARLPHAAFHRAPRRRNLADG
ncbi:hypothetical protein WOLCODRAFT_161761, partial [Wolfiporia cocos MD-104 SS10]